MLIKMDEGLLEEIACVIKINDFEIYDGLVDFKTLEKIIFRLIEKNDDLYEELENLKEEVEENYIRKRDDYDFYGVSHSDFGK